MKYAKLDSYGHIIRDWDEIHRIRADFDRYRETKDQAILTPYLQNWQSLAEELADETSTTKSLALAYWDDVHPLSKEDHARFSLMMRKQLIDAKIMSQVYDNASHADYAVDNEGKATVFLCVLMEG